LASVRLTSVYSSNHKNCVFLTENGNLNVRLSST